MFFKIWIYWLSHKYGCLATVLDHIKKIIYLDKTRHRPVPQISCTIFKLISKISETPQ